MVSSLPLRFAGIRMVGTKITAPLSLNLATVFSAIRRGLLLRFLRSFLFGFFGSLLRSLFGFLLR
ncbi:UNVERIFIED_CONTAM: hypothetical protein LK11_07505 [Mumia flava]